MGCDKNGRWCWQFFKHLWPWQNWTGKGQSPATSTTLYYPHHKVELFNKILFDYENRYVNRKWTTIQSSTFVCVWVIIHCCLHASTHLEEPAIRFRAMLTNKVKHDSIGVRHECQCRRGCIPDIGEFCLMLVELWHQLCGNGLGIKS